MKVKELIERLSTMNPNADVFVDGYEGGYDEVIPANVRESRMMMKPFHSQDSYTGIFESHKDGYIEGVIISRTT